MSSSSSSRPKAVAAKPPAAAAAAASSSSASLPTPVHLNTRPDQNPAHQRMPNRHLTADMEKLCAAQHAAKHRRMGRQPPPRTAADGPVYVDMMDATYDRLEGQNFVVISFVSPEQAIQRREEFMLQEFIQWNDFSASWKVCADYADFMAAKYSLDEDVMKEDFDEFMATESARLRDVDVTTKFGLFCKKNGKDLQKKYEALNGRETAVRGLNVLGVVETKEEADALVRSIAADHVAHPDIMYGQVGHWLAWNPTNLIKREYLEPELNELMAGREVKEARKTETFEQRKKSMIQGAMDQNAANATKFGTKTTMELGADGRPVNTTRDDHGQKNFMATFDGTGIDTMMDGEDVGSLHEMLAKAKLEGRNEPPARPIDLATGEEAAEADLVAARLRALWVADEGAAAADEESGGGGGGGVVDDDDDDDNY